MMREEDEDIWAVPKVDFETWWARNTLDDDPAVKELARIVWNACLESACDYFCHYEGVCYDADRVLKG